MRRPIIAGNWKMYLTPEEGAALAVALAPRAAARADVDVVVCPAMPLLESVGRALAGASLKLGAQNLYPMAEGAFTGEASPKMLVALGCEYCIIGHSERRQYFAEKNAFVNAKVKAALEFDLTPIVCIGETLEEREKKLTFDVVGAQLEGAFEQISAEQAAGIVVAYEPVWAIGTGHTATPEQAQEVHAFIRLKLGRKYGDKTAQAMRLQYGGSVKPDNVDSLMAQPDIDGALVGGASLKVDSFARILNFKR
ncbi:MAG: triose-phosphate isomerase [Myxococcales bacterium]|nr:MAG: triose-phosphate isomerase [Myxococcales bacterium]